MSNQVRAMEIALEVHQHQVDKGGAPYIGHPVRVANGCNWPDHMDISRIPDPSPLDMARLAKYPLAKQLLLSL